MQIRTLAAMLNGGLVLAMHGTTFGAPSWTIAGLEIVLATGAAACTWYALRQATTRIALPSWRPLS